MQRRSTTDLEWEKWGGQDPYRGVLGIDSANLTTERKAKFFDSGRQHIDKVCQLVETHFGPLASEGAALDFGCGVGRLVVPLASRFRRVVGVDVSSSMLENARQNSAGLDNVELVLGLDNVKNRQKAYAFVHSYIVMQHIRPVQGMAILEDLIGCVEPGGAFAIHVTLGDMKPRRRRLNMIRYRVRPVHWLYNIVRGRPVSEPITEMNAYSAASVFDLFRRCGCAPILVEPLDQNRHVGVLLIGRKAMN